MPDKDHLDTRSYDELNAALAFAQHTVYKKYLNELENYPLVPPTQILMDEEPRECIRAFHLAQLTCKKGEDIFQKLSTVYHATMSLGCSMVVMVDVAYVGGPAKIYLGIRNPDDVPDRLSTSYNALRDGISSNFPGTQMEEISSSKKLPEELNDIFGKDAKCISSVSCVAAIRDRSKTENKTFVQGLEKLIDVMRGKTYTALFIAEPISPQQQSNIRSGYEGLYSTLSAFRKSVWSYQENESIGVMESLSDGISKSVTEGISHTQSHTVARMTGTSNTVGIGINFGGNAGKTNGSSRTEGKNKPTAVSRAGNVLSKAGDSLAYSPEANKLVTGAVATVAAKVVDAIVPGAGTAIKLAVPVLGKVLPIAASTVGSAMQGSSGSAAMTESIAKSMGVSGGLGGNYSHGKQKSETVSQGESEQKSRSESEAKIQTKTEGKTDIKGSGRILQIENVNKSVEEMLKRIEEQLKRVQECEDYGAYSCGAYFLSSRRENSLLAANTYRALMLGEGSSVESGAVNFWKDEEIVRNMKEYLRRFAQPIFVLPLDQESGMLYSPGTIVSGLELPLHLGLPTRSVVGLPVIDHAEFGRNVDVSEPSVRLGELYHMGQIEKGVTVRLCKQSLASHLFITGSTGSGKSNVVSHILNSLDKQGVHFLVLEPAKGEYKNVFGGREDVSVYGTNAKKSQLLQMNPFSFPDDIHVLEHIDRLVEIFNACWPMYAAMPAVLKDGIEQAYRRRGWDLTTSYSALGEFPTFQDLNSELPAVMERSAYSADTKGDYVGALLTRVKSLTNGINGQIFCAADELSQEELFDRNVIVDISRVGSMETKALIMGILVMKLQEYRMVSGKMNVELSHVTVLEEAHHLLRRSSNVQTQESSNLQGKSVEMLANAIAEMRTYGEGFVIADQAPELMDLSVIRNTNTKIILRLPDESDRMLVGKAASLNEDQIGELAKLPLGVAAVYQNDWMEPVLCQFPRFEQCWPYEFHQKPDPEYFTTFFKKLFGVSDGKELQKEEIEKISRWINCLEESAYIRKLLFQCMRGEPLTETERCIVAYDLFEGKLMAEILEKTADEKEGIRLMEQQISHMNGIHEYSLAEQIRQFILQAIFTHADTPRFRERFSQYALERRVL